MTDLRKAAEMKKLLAALLMVPAIAQAEAWSMPNQNGGEVVITDRDCMFKGESYAPLKEAYAYSDGTYIEGCWTAQDGMIRIIWRTSKGAESRIYEPSDFSIKNKDKKENQRRSVS